MNDATTFDVYILDVSAKWAKYQQDIHEGKIDSESDYTEDELLAILNSTKEKSNAVD